MTDKEKIHLADYIINAVKDKIADSDIATFVGTLNKAQGLKGFETAEIGHAVFDINDRYVIYLERNDKALTIAVPYYKHSLKDVIKFN